MGTRQPGRQGHPFLRGPLIVVVLVYLVLTACLGGLAYLISGNPWPGLAPGIGGLLGMLLIRTPPVRRWLNQLYASRQGGGPPDGDVP